MRLVSWNVCDAFNRKFGHLERLRPDIAVVQEVRPGCIDFARLTDRALWLGDSGQKGLAAIGYGDWTLVPGPVVSERWFIPVVASNGVERVHLVAVWLDSSADCGAPTLRALDALEPFLRAAPSCLVGDFNQCVALDARKPKGRKFGDVLSRLDGLGMSSAWHTATGEAHGEESRATLYWRWSLDRPFHIDFAFGSREMRVRKAEIGTHEQYVAGEMSDHVPLVVDYEITRRSV
ncbi:MAG: endonuclease/exonuclease/phosphatase family protein [Phenylobacterium sp.]|jgi:endonuclease/exonuclease/phosphatase family metal-dependent hydrolase|uniref:endonuclease/exonuclease/phosphatase family protein n=1 Tax=Phenylobacterium sp. TaxID=1871053 RepID=UPI00391DCA68